MKFDSVVGMAEDLATDEGVVADELTCYVEIEGEIVELNDVVLSEDEDGEFRIIFRDIDYVALEIAQSERKLKPKLKRQS